MVNEVYRLLFATGTWEIRKPNLAELAGFQENPPSAQSVTR